MPEPDNHALGRSRGGWTTKIHALVDHLLRPVGLVLTAGQAGDNPQLVPLLDAYQAAVHRSGRNFHLLADRAYSHPSTRRELRSRRIRHTIPERRDQKEVRAAKGSKGGRPPGFDRALYAERNTIERSIGRIKHRRGVATRYDKYALTFLAAFCSRRPSNTDADQSGDTP